MGAPNNYDSVNTGSGLVSMETSITMNLSNQCDTTTNDNTYDDEHNRDCKSEHSVPEQHDCDMTESIHDDAQASGDTLYISNLHTSVKSEDLKLRFEKFGTIKECRIVVNPVSKESRGFAFLRFSNHRAADDAMKVMDGNIIDGGAIGVEKAKRSRPHNRTPGQYKGPSGASIKYDTRGRLKPGFVPYWDLPPPRGPSYVNTFGGEDSRRRSPYRRSTLKYRSQTDTPAGRRLGLPARGRSPVNREHAPRSSYHFRGAGDRIMNYEMSGAHWAGTQSYSSTHSRVADNVYTGRDAARPPYGRSYRDVRTGGYGMERGSTNRNPYGLSEYVSIPGGHVSERDVYHSEHLGPVDTYIHRRSLYGNQHNPMYGDSAAYAEVYGSDVASYKRIRDMSKINCEPPPYHPQSYFHRSGMRNRERYVTDYDPRRTRSRSRNHKQVLIGCPKFDSKLTKRISPSRVRRPSITHNLSSKRPRQSYAAVGRRV